MNARAKKEAQAVLRVLRKKKLRIVFAESCTGGLAAATMTSIPGASDYFCGSFVTYRDASKKKWIGVSKRKLKSPGAVSRIIAGQMARGALRKTPEAKIAFSITGHLGPGAPKSQDGVFYVACAMQSKKKSKSQTECPVFKHVLPKASRGMSSQTARQKRQELASFFFLKVVRSLLK